ncbi:MAG: patatin-like phospholipase family protein [Burkholderiales bacterium]|jgi:NTE family protein|nr:patatin-like phospholipase family protein [Burkholderiales bacterium]
MRPSGKIPAAVRRAAALVIAGAVLAGCATRPVNPPIGHVDPDKTHRVQRPASVLEDDATLVILAFSGGGTRAAAFSYGVLETLRDMQSTTRSGRRVRVLDTVDVITGISGGSFTALAFGLYGDKLFDTYEQAFLKRNVQGELIARALSPANWAALGSVGWGRSELAADFYDEILFKNATYRDLRRDGPRILVSATDLTDGTRIIFNQENFDILCTELAPMRLSRAAAASSAVPVVLSSITIDNYGGTCGYQPPPWTGMFLNEPNPPRPAARTVKRLQELQAFADRKERPFLHLVDGGVSDNVGMRGVLDVMSTFEALHGAGEKTPYDNVRNIFVFVVNSLAVAPNDWSRHEDSPGLFDVLMKATGTPIDTYSYDTVETLKDIQARWASLREIRSVIAPHPDLAAKLPSVMRAPDINIRVIDVSFAAVPDEKERAFLNTLPTSFVLSDEAVDRLRVAAKDAILASPEVRRLIANDALRMVGPGPRVGAAGAGARK